MKNQVLFVGSGFLACAAYALLLSLLLIQIQTPKPTPTILQTMDIDFLLETPAKLPTPKEASKPIPTPPKNTPQPDQNPFKQDLGVQDVFSSIQGFKHAPPSPKKATPPPQPSMSKEQIQQMRQAQELLQGIQFSQHQQAFKDLQSSLNNFQEHLQVIKKKDIDFQVPQKENTSDQEFKAWVQQIYKILDDQWHLHFYQKTQASVMIYISEEGKLQFSMLKPSPFADFNQQVLTFLNALKNKTFPPYPGRRAITLQVNFKTKD